MNLRAFSVIAGVTIGIVRLHAIFEQIRLFSAANLSQSERMFPLLNGILLLAVPALLVQVGTSNVQLRITESSRVLAIVTALAYAGLSTLPSMYQVLRVWSRLNSVQVVWLMAGLAGQLMVMLFLVAFAAEREPTDPRGIAAPYQSSSLRTVSLAALWASTIAIAIHIVVTALMFTDVYGSEASRQSYLGAAPQILWIRFTGLVPVVTSFVMALLVYLSDPAKETHYETSVAGGRG
jgi:hypothetical protein